MWSSPASSTNRAPGMLLGEVAALLDADVDVAGAVHDQRRHAHRRQHVADVDLGVHAHQRDAAAGARAAPEAGGQPLLDRRRRSTRRQLVEVDARPSCARRQLGSTPPAPPASAPTGSRGSRQRFANAPYNTSARHPLRVGGGEQHAHQCHPPRSRRRAARSEPTASITARTSSIRVSSVGSRRRDAVGHAGAALVEQDQPRERRQPLEEARMRGSSQANSTFEIQPGTRRGRRALADHLVGDVDVPASGVPRLWRHQDGG